jgi:hypothetical protein
LRGILDYSSFISILILIVFLISFLKKDQGNRKRGIHFGPVLVKAQKLAYQYAKALNIEYSPTGNQNMNWDYSFYVTNVTELYVNLFKVLEEHNLQPNQNINLEESQLSIVCIVFPLYWRVYQYIVCFVIKKRCATSQVI